MANKVFFCSTGHRFVQPIGLSFFLFLLLNVIGLDVAAKHTKHPSDTIVEKKADYLLRIYFSGVDKAGLTAKILVALQEIEGKQPTAAMQKQHTFLQQIKERVAAAATTCDVLDMFAVGIFEIDAIEADRQGVKLPSDNAKANTADISSALNKLSSSSGSLSSSASNLAWQNTLATGKTTAVGSSANKVAGTTSNIASGAATAGQALETGKQLSSVFGTVLGGKKSEKPCKDVKPKEIEIGYHPDLTQAAVAAVNNTSDPAPQTQGAMVTVITISKVSSTVLRELADGLKNKEGVLNVEKSYEQANSTITVNHTGKTDVLSDWIEDKFGKKLTLLSNSSGKISLAAKQ